MSRENVRSRILIYPNYLHGETTTPAIVSGRGLEGVNREYIIQTLKALLAQDALFPEPRRESGPLSLDLARAITPIYSHGSLLRAHGNIFNAVFETQECPQGDNYFQESPVPGIDAICWSIFLARAQMHRGSVPGMLAEAAQLLNGSQLIALFENRELSDNLFFGHRIDPSCSEDAWRRIGTSNIPLQTLEGSRDNFGRASALAELCRILARRHFREVRLTGELLDAVRSIHERERAILNAFFESESQLPQADIAPQGSQG